MILYILPRYLISRVLLHVKTENLPDAPHVDGFTVLFPKEDFGSRIAHTTSRGGERMMVRIKVSSATSHSSGVSACYTKDGSRDLAYTPKSAITRPECGSLVRYKMFSGLRSL